MPRSPSRARLRIGIDTGGTFTDIVALDAASGAIRVTTVATNALLQGEIRSLGLIVTSRLPPLLPRV